MEYTIQKLGVLAGISTRTLRYYDEIGMLKPARINSSGYRIYGEDEVNLLQQILFYRELGVSLEQIKEILTSPTFDKMKALEEHKIKLLEKQERLNTLIANVEKTIATGKGEMTMSNEEKFEGFKKKMLNENEQKYGTEIREKYGEETIHKANEQFMNMSPEDYEKVTELDKQIIETLLVAMKTGDTASELAQKTADLHKQWISYFWSKYSKEAHVALAQMYVDDERFTVYYDQHQEGAAKFLRDAICIYTGMSEKWG